MATAKGPERVQIHFRCLPVFADRMDAQSFSEGLTRTEWIVKTLGIALDESHRRIEPSLQGRPINCDRANEGEVP